MIDKLIKYFKKHPILFTGGIFALFSIIINVFMILFIDRAYAYDVVHSIPTVLFYEYFLDSLLGGMLTSQFYLLPILIVIDCLVGFIVGGLIKLFTKSTEASLIVLSILFIVYWFIICFQWLPIL